MMTARRCLGAVVCVLAASAAQGAHAEDGDDAVAPVDPLAVTVVELGSASRHERFAAARRLPRPAGTLESALTRLVARRFDAPDGADTSIARDPRGDDPRADASAADGADTWTRSFGDLVAAFGDIRRSDARVVALLARLERERPDVWDAVRDVLPALVRTARVYRADWDPDDAHDDDGFLFVPPYSLSARRDAPWRDQSGSRDVHQAALLVWADDAALKSAESDYPAYVGRKGSTTTEIGVVDGSCVRGRDESGEWLALAVRSRADMPWPFSDLVGVVDTLTERDAAGRVVTHVWGTGDDYLWLAGRDTFVPVHDADGAFVATLVVRELGFDLAGIPEGDGHRRAAMRSPLGALKLGAEARAAARERDAAAPRPFDEDAGRRPSPGADDAGRVPIGARRDDPLPEFAVRSPR